MAKRLSWRCFHCGDLFTNPKHAASHFGIDQGSEPGCVAVLRHGESHLLDRIWDLEAQLRRHRIEDSDIMRWQWAKQAEHATALRLEEEKGYARGLRDAKADGLVAGAEQGRRVSGGGGNPEIAAAVKEADQ